MFPARWQVLPFSEAVKDATAQYSKLQKSEYLEQGKFPIIDQGQQHFGGYTNDSSVISVNSCPAIVFGDHTRVFKFIDEPFCLGADGAKVLEPKVVLDKKFLFHYLSSLNIESAGYSRHFKFLKENVVPVPPLPEQKRIAAILDKADDIRRKRQQAIQLADDFLRAVFLDMFGDPATNPKGWPVFEMSDVIEFKGGSQPPKETFEYEEKEGYTRLVQIRDFRTDKYKTYIPDHLAKRKFEIDDVMIGRYGPPVFQILRGLTGSYNVALMKAVPKSGATKDFIYRLLQLPFYQEAVISNSERTAGQTGVNLDFLYRLRVPLPPPGVQAAIAEKLGRVEDLLGCMRSALVDVDLIFESTSQKAFSGQL
tara:strand:- start:695 stop:1792 length:1098 start_codon:yes stop_codon:yes gene_type:complete